MTTLVRTQQLAHDVWDILGNERQIVGTKILIFAKNIWQFNDTICCLWRHKYVSLVSLIIHLVSLIIHLVSVSFVVSEYLLSFGVCGLFKTNIKNSPAGTKILIFAVKYDRTLNWWYYMLSLMSYEQVRCFIDYSLSFGVYRYHKGIKPVPVNWIHEFQY